MAAEFSRGKNFFVRAKTIAVSFNELEVYRDKYSYPAFLIKGCSLPVAANKVLYA